MSTLSNTSLRILNAFLFVVWGGIALVGLFAGTAHGGEITAFHEFLFSIAAITTCFYPLALIFSAMDKTAKSITWPGISIIIQAVATIIAVVSRFY